MYLVWELFFDLNWLVGVDTPTGASLVGKKIGQVIHSPGLS